MADYSDGFNEHADSLRLRREADDRDDYNFAVSGVDVGRQRKHLQNDEIDPLTGEKKKDALEKAIQRTLDWLLLNDEAYRLRHENLIASIRDTQREAERALVSVMSELDGAQEAMSNLRDRAARLPDGRLVFKDEDGNVRTEDGQLVPPEIAAEIEWTGNEPSFEEYDALRLRIQELTRTENELRGIETDIGGIRGRATDNENPLMPDEQEDAQGRIDGLRKRIKDISETLSNDLKQRAERAHNQMPNEYEASAKSGTTLPKIGTQN